MGVAVTRNAPKYWGFLKSVSILSPDISAEARGQESREAPTFLPSCGSCGSALAHSALLICETEAGLEHAQDPAEPLLNMIYHIRLPPRACFLHIDQRQSSLCCLPRAYGSIQHTLVGFFLSTIVRYFTLLYTILFNITKHTTVFLP